MRYSIHYEPEKGDRYPPVTETGHKIGVRIIAGLLTIAALIAGIRYKEAVISWLIPGDDQITIHAAEELICRLQEGVPVGEAVTTFCEEIIENG